MSEFVEDVRARMVAGMTEKLGISAEVAGLLAGEVLAEIYQDWKGERPYIGPPKEAAEQREARNRALFRDWKNGERIPFLARRYQISIKRVYALLKLSRAVA